MYSKIIKILPHLSMLESYESKQQWFNLPSHPMKDFVLPLHPSSLQEVKGVQQFSRVPKHKSIQVGQNHDHE